MAKSKLDKRQRIELAQQHWAVKVRDLVEGDLIWLTRTEPEMYIREHEPCPIEFLKKGVCMVYDSWGEEMLIRLSDGELVLRAPKDFEEKSKLYTSDEYWLEVADKLNI